MPNFCEGSHHCLQLLRRVRGRGLIWIARSCCLETLKALIQLVLDLKQPHVIADSYTRYARSLCRRKVGIVRIQEPIISPLRQVNQFEMGLCNPKPGNLLSWPCSPPTSLDHARPQGAASRIVLTNASGLAMKP
jgi:hypothetical protein